MKKYYLLPILFLGFFSRLPAHAHFTSHATSQAQATLPARAGAPSQIRDSLEGLPGLYQPSIDLSQKFRIRRDKANFILEVVGQGETDLISLGGNRYSPRQVSRPRSLNLSGTAWAPFTNSPGSRIIRGKKEN